MIPQFDILGLGCVAVDDLLYVAGYPAADAKTRVLRRERQCGGLTATALVAAARLGARCAYAATLGDDELSRFVVDRLLDEGVDVSMVRTAEHARPIHSIIVVDETRQTRTIFYSLEGAQGAQPDWPGADAVRAARALFVDHFGVEGMVAAARAAREAGIPLVADFEDDSGPAFADLLGLVDHLIVGREFATQLSGESEPASAASRLGTLGRQVVVVTCGAQGCWYIGSGDSSATHQAAFSVPVADTTGCGDVFHGAYTAGLVQGLDLASRVRLASAAAALKAMRRGGQAGIPTGQAVQRFLELQST